MPLGPRSREMLAERIIAGWLIAPTTVSLDLESCSYQSYVLCSPPSPFLPDAELSNRRLWLRDSPVTWMKLSQNYAIV